MSSARRLDVAAALDPALDAGVGRARGRTLGSALNLLDGFQLRSRGSVHRVPMSVQRLLAFLALQNRPVQRLFVAGNLWLAASEEHANASLRTALWRLRLLDSRLVDATPTHVALVSDMAVDVRDVTSAALRAIAGSARARDVAALRSSRDLLPDWYDDWVVVERERFRQIRLHALDALCESFSAAGRYADAADAALCAIADDPLRESAHRALIRTHLREGNPGEAIRHYGLYRDVLARRLGLEPSAELQALLESVTSPQTKGRVDAGARVTLQALALLA